MEVLVREVRFAHTIDALDLAPVYRYVAVDPIIGALKVGEKAGKLLLGMCMRANGLDYHLVYDVDQGKWWAAVAPEQDDEGAMLC